MLHIVIAVHFSTFNVTIVVPHEHGFDERSGGIG